MQHLTKTVQVHEWLGGKHQPLHDGQQIMGNTRPTIHERSKLHTLQHQYTNPSGVKDIRKEILSTVNDLLFENENHPGHAHNHF